MKRRSLIVLSITLSVFLFSCTKSAMLNEDFSLSQQSKERPPEELATITGRINPADVKASIVAWNELYTSEPVEVNEKDGSFTLVVPAWEYYHLNITYTSSTGESVTFIKPKVVVTANAVTDVGEIALQ